MLFQSRHHCLPEPAINIYGTPRKLTCLEKNWYNRYTLQHFLLSYCLTHSRCSINLYWRVDKITEKWYTNLRYCEPVFTSVSAFVLYMHLHVLVLKNRNTRNSLRAAARGLLSPRPPRQRPAGVLNEKEGADTEKECTFQNALLVVNGVQIHNRESSSHCSQRLSRTKPQPEARPSRCIPAVCVCAASERSSCGVSTNGLRRLRPVRCATMSLFVFLPANQRGSVTTNQNVQSCCQAKLFTPCLHKNGPIRIRQALLKRQPQL